MVVALKRWPYVGKAKMSLGGGRFFSKIVIKQLKNILKYSKIEKTAISQMHFVFTSMESKTPLSTVLQIKTILSKVSPYTTRHLPSVWWQRYSLDISEEPNFDFWKGLSIFGSLYKLTISSCIQEEFSNIFETKISYAWKGWHIHIWFISKINIDSKIQKPFHFIDVPIIRCFDEFLSQVLLWLS